MWLATIAEDSGPVAAVVQAGRVLPLGDVPGLASVRAIAAAGPAGLERVAARVDAAPPSAWRSLLGVVLGPAVPDPGAIYAIGFNYRPAGTPESADDDPGAPQRPLVYGKAPGSVAAHGGLLAWDRSLTTNVDPECELGIVIGREASGVAADDAMGHVLGYTIVDDISSRDPWLDGDQWLLGKSMPGFCPVGPWIVTPDELDPVDLRLGCTLNGKPIQDGSTAQLRFPIADMIAFLSRHLTLRPGDLIATGTPQRLATPPGPDRHLEPGDTVTAWIEGIGELTTHIGASTQEGER